MTAARARVAAGIAVAVVGTALGMFVGSLLAAATALSWDSAFRLASPTTVATAQAVGGGALVLASWCGGVAIARREVAWSRAAALLLGAAVLIWLAASVAAYS